MTWIGIYLVAYGALAIGHIAVQMLFGQLEHRRQQRATYRGEMPSVTVVVPAYNEDPALLHRCLLSIDRQTHPRVDTIVVDDGSRNLSDVLPVHDEFDGHPFRVVHRPDNTGKRHCQAVVFEQAQTDIVVTIDSDTVLQPDAIAMIVRRFEDPRVGAVTGNVEVINRRQNLLTRLIGYRYWTAFNQERAAQSLFGVVMCASGPFSAYRRAILDEVRDAYVNQTFLGQVCTYGDDRHLTNLVLSLGHRVVYDEHAVAHTLVPSKMGAYVRQQTRWNKSFYREILWSAKFAHRRHPYLGLDLGLQIVMPFALMFALVLTAFQATSNPMVALRYLGVVVAIGLVRAVYGTLRTRSVGFLLFLLYGFVHVLVLIPVRLYALATMRDGGWGSRLSTGADETGRRKTLHARSDAGLAEAAQAWAADLHDVIERGQGFRLFWQPVLRLGCDEITHAEILLRLAHGDNVLPPGAFLTIAARGGLMSSVDRRVVADAVALLAVADEPLRLEVNLSSATIRDAGFPLLLHRLLAAAEIAPRNLVLAIAEADAAVNPGVALTFARRIRALGCMVALDRVNGDCDIDETFALIDSLPVDYVKIGGDLIRRALHSAEARAHLGNVAGHAHLRGIEAIAVGVGDADTLDMLGHMHIDLAQGFFIGTPAPVSTPLTQIAQDASAQQAAGSVS